MRGGNIELLCTRLQGCTCAHMLAVATRRAHEEAERTRHFLGRTLTCLISCFFVRDCVTQKNGINVRIHNQAATREQRDSRQVPPRKVFFEKDAPYLGRGAGEQSHVSSKQSHDS